MKLHGQIMNIPADHNKTVEEYSDRRNAYIFGHRDARHAAAELALKADSCIDALRLIMRWVEAAALERDSLNWDVINNDEGQRAREALASMDGLVLVRPNV